MKKKFFDTCRKYGYEANYSGLKGGFYVRPVKHFFGVYVNIDMLKDFLNFHNLEKYKIL